MLFINIMTKQKGTHIDTYNYQLLSISESNSLSLFLALGHSATISLCGVTSKIFSYPTHNSCTIAVVMQLYLLIVLYIFHYWYKQKDLYSSPSYLLSKPC